MTQKDVEESIDSNVSDASSAESVIDPVEASEALLELNNFETQVPSVRVSFAPDDDVEETLQASKEGSVNSVSGSVNTVSGVSALSSSKKSSDDDVEDGDLPEGWLSTKLHLLLDELEEAKEKEKDLEKCNKKLNDTIEKNKKAYDKKVVELNVSVKSLKKELTAVKKENVSLASSGAVSAEVIKAQKAEASKKLAEALKSKKNLDGRISKLEGEATKRALDLGRYRARVTELESEIQSTKRIYKEEIAELKKQKKSHEDNAKDLEKEVKVLKKKVETLESLDRVHEAKIAEWNYKKIEVAQLEQTKREREKQQHEIESMRSKHKYLDHKHWTAEDRKEREAKRKAKNEDDKLNKGLERQRAMLAELPLPNQMRPSGNYSTRYQVPAPMPGAAPGTFPTKMEDAIEYARTSHIPSPVHTYVPSRPPLQWNASPPFDNRKQPPTYSTPIASNGERSAKRPKISKSAKRSVNEENRRFVQSTLTQEWGHVDVANDDYCPPHLDDVEDDSAILAEHVRSNDSLYNHYIRKQNYDDGNLSNPVVLMDDSADGASVANSSISTKVSIDLLADSDKEN